MHACRFLWESAGRLVEWGWSADLQVCMCVGVYPRKYMRARVCACESETERVRERGGGEGGGRLCVAACMWLCMCVCAPILCPSPHMHTQASLPYPAHTQLVVMEDTGQLHLLYPARMYVFTNIPPSYAAGRGGGHGPGVPPVGEGREAAGVIAGRGG